MLEFAKMKAITIPEGSVKKITANGVTLWEKSARFTNLLPMATNADRKTIYGGDYNGDGINDGYSQNRRLSSSGSDAARDGCCCTGYIPAKAGDVLRVKGILNAHGISTYIIAYDSSNTKTNYKTTFVNGGLWFPIGDSETIYEATLSANAFGNNFNAIRISGVIDGNTIVTINQEITE